MGYRDHGYKPNIRVIPLQVIPKPVTGTRTVLQQSPDYDGPSTVIVNVTAEGNSTDERINYICGKCGALLVRGAFRGQLQNIVLHCSKCDSYNNLP